MKTDDGALSASVRSFRRATGAATDGRATRARVLAAAAASGRRRAIVRRLSIGVTIGIVIALSGSAAWTAIGQWLSRPRPVAIGEPARAARADSSALAVVAPMVVSPGTSEHPKIFPAAIPPTDDGEARDYGRAHQAHFEADDPRAALALWNVYLRRYPQGAFVPEARFNRALCLLRLDHRDAAAQALRPFAAGAFDGYRTREARTLLDWIGR
ncbi:MAG TPA: hypothetical protein VH374_05275 [Polyangia bacterium]|jgi:hypothetical protein|nr:hypothetical protein [Polyangia bacterium]